MNASFVRAGLRDCLTGSQSVCFSVVGSRIMLNLRSVSKGSGPILVSGHRHSVETSHSFYPAIEFAERSAEVRSADYLES